jgi:hypothetical protein
MLARTRLRIRKVVRSARLACRNRWSHAPVTTPGRPTVSMTSHGRRLRLVHLALESIAAGSVRPGRLVLWLDDLDVVSHPTPGLRRLIARGLEVHPTVDLKPHKKYYPYVQSIERHVAPLVTADDDLMYPVDWLETLLDAHAGDPSTNTAHRARAVRTDAEGRIAPYADWRAARPGASSPRHLATGNWGHVIVPTMLDALRDREAEFLADAPTADDLWLHRVAVELGVAPKVTGTYTVDDFLHLPDGGSSLADANVDGSGNDRQIRAAWPAGVVATIAGTPPVHATRS